MSEYKNETKSSILSTARFLPPKPSLPWFLSLYLPCWDTNGINKRQIYYNNWKAWMLLQILNVTLKIWFWRGLPKFFCSSGAENTCVRGWHIYHHILRRILLSENTYERKRKKQHFLSKWREYSVWVNASKRLVLFSGAAHQKFRINSFPQIHWIRNWKPRKKWTKENTIYSMQWNFVTIQLTSLDWKEFATRQPNRII